MFTFWGRTKKEAGGFFFADFQNFTIQSYLFSFVISPELLFLKSSYTSIIPPPPQAPEN